jgi:hypothetical protein
MRSTFISTHLLLSAASSTSALTRGIDVVYAIAPAHSAAITSATLRMPAFAGCVKLAQVLPPHTVLQHIVHLRVPLTLFLQRWLAAECMGGCIPHNALELLCASVCASGCRCMTFFVVAFFVFCFKTPLLWLQAAFDSMGRVHALARPHGAHGFCGAGNEATHFGPSLSVVILECRCSQSILHRHGPHPLPPRTQSQPHQLQPRLPLQPPSNTLMFVR